MPYVPCYWSFLAEEVFIEQRGLLEKNIRREELHMVLDDYLPAKIHWINSQKVLYRFANLDRPNTYFKLSADLRALNVKVENSMAEVPPLRNRFLNST